MGRKRIANFPLLALLSMVLAGCAYMKPNPTDPRVMGPGSPGDPNATRVGGDEGLFTLGGGSKTKGDSGGGGNNFTVDDVSFTGSQDAGVETVVPEPGTLALLLGGIGVVALVRRKRTS